MWLKKCPTQQYLPMELGIFDSYIFLFPLLLLFPTNSECRMEAWFQSDLLNTIISQTKSFNVLSTSFILPDKLSPCTPKNTRSFTKILTDIMFNKMFNLTIVRVNYKIENPAYYISNLIFKINYCDKTQLNFVKLSVSLNL